MNGETVTALDLIHDWGARCYLCEQDIDLRLLYPDPLCFSFDHLIPLAKGGPHARINLRPAHLKCNMAKGAKVLGDDLEALRRAIGC